jgi:diguanylate cyclase
MLLWATITSFLIFGLVGLGQPIEDGFRIARNKLRSQEASGTIVVVAIDDRSVDEVADWPWPRRYHAQLIDKLLALGADRVVFDLDFSARATLKDDHQFEAALARSKSKVILPVRFVDSPVTRRRSELLPLEDFRRHAQLANANARYNYRSEVWRLHYALKTQDASYPSLAAKLAERFGGTGRTFRIDYSIGLQTIPTVSAIDLLQGRIPREAVAGKKIIIGPASSQFGLNHFVPGHGQAPGTYVHVLGAETLLRGRQIDLGWLIPFAVIFGLNAVYLFARPRWIARAAVGSGLLLLLVVPVAAEAKLIFFDVIPALALLLTVVTMSAWTNFRQSYRARGMVNVVSGLPNLAALREDATTAVGALVAARVHNYAQITSALPPESERALVEQIAARLEVGTGGSRIHQGDEGIFVWLAAEESSASLGDQLEALHALCRTPIVVAGTHVDIAVTFGIDAGDRSISSRIGSALVAADEATTEGRRWKEFDAAKLKDAPWKLSLLGRLDAAIDGGEIWVAYQPKLDLATKRIVGAEALARWSHPEKGDISPAEFIFAAEQHNRIEKLTDHVLNEAIKAAASINLEGTDFDIAVNLSARLLDSAGLVDRIAMLLAQHRLPATHLTLEVTESAAMTGSDRSIEVLGRLRTLGVNISIDDYGTGFSTLEALKKIPATEIKVDMSFVRMIDRSHSDRLMVNSTIQLAHSLGRSVVAEGVETPDVLYALEAMGCDQAQGYLIGRPMHLFDLQKLLPSTLASTAA